MDPGRAGPEAKVADRLVSDVRLLAKLPDLIRRIDYYFPPPGAAPPTAPLPEITVVQPRGIGLYLLVAIVAGAIGAAIASLLA